MALLNSQYDRIMRHYDLIRNLHSRELADRTEEIRTKIPQIRELDDHVSTLAAQEARKQILGGKADLRSFDEASEKASAEKKALLAENGYPEDYLEMQYDCPICRDTGFVDGRKCVCFRREEIRLLYDQYELGDILKEENFAHFSFECYSDTIVNEKTGKTPRETAHEAYAAARKFVSGIGKRGNNLLLYGNTGVGKTFLSHCIAKEVLERSYSALYFSSHDFFRIMADSEFSRHPEDESYGQMITECDLLILDDLGTELTNTLVNAQLFRVVNERILRNLSTIISTNLGLNEFTDHYSERVFSRIASRYEIIRLTGEDIRLQKKFQGGRK